MPAPQLRWRAINENPCEAEQTLNRPRNFAPTTETLEAVARVIAERATDATLDRDLAVICNLLRQECYWSDEACGRLRFRLGAELCRRGASNLVRISGSR